MNTIEELTNKYGIEIFTAQMMIDTYEKRIGNVNGVIVIEDVTYVGDGNKEVKLRCNLCGKEYLSILKRDKNKWSELRRSCSCQMNIRREVSRKRLLKEKQDRLDKIKREEIGKAYGDFKVVEVVSSSVLKCQCERCGYTRTLAYNKRETSDMHCTKHIVEKFTKAYIGRKNNYLTVIDIGKAKDGHKRFICQCDCGKTTSVKPTFWEDGRVKSCGCLYESLKVEHTPELDRLRNIHNGMVQRCYNPNCDAYRIYGGRGIHICDEWLNDFNIFAEWALSHGYRNDLTIDRIDVDGNYEPNNCRWADWVTQANNKRPYTRGVKYQIGDKAYTARQLSDMYGLDYHALTYRLKMGMKPVIAMLEVKHRQDRGIYGKTDK